MMRLAIIGLFGAALSQQGTADAASIEDRTLEYRCDDVVVVGRVYSHAYDRIPNDEDLIGHGKIRATVKVRRVIRDQNLSDTIPANYFAHVYMRDDRDFMLILRKENDGLFMIAGGQLMSARPKLAARCG